MTNVSEAFLEYLDLEGSGLDLQDFLAKYPEMAPRLEKKINAHRLFRQVFSALPPVESPTAEPLDGPMREGEFLGDDFQVLKELGRGGMGVIYLARQLSIDRLVALKILSPHISASQSMRQRFLNEARAIGKLRHPHIVNVHLAGEWRGLLFIAMEYVPGVGLDEMISELSKRGFIRPTGRDFYDRLEILLNSRGTKPQISAADRNGTYPSLVARLIGEMARALDHAHRQGIIHRDIKPSNVLIDEQGQGRLIDFGLNLEIGSQGVTQPFELFGSASYLAPERLSGVAESELVDIYGLGVTLYEALTLRTAFKGRTVAETLDLLKRNKSLLPRRINPLIPRSLEGIVMAAIDRNPKRRYQSASDFAEDLDRFLEGLPVRARPVSRMRTLAAWIRRPFFLVALGVAAAVIFLSPWQRMANITEGMALQMGQRLETKLVEGVTAWFNWALRSSLGHARTDAARAKTHKDFPDTKHPMASTPAAEVNKELSRIREKYGLTLTPPEGWQVRLKNDQGALILFNSNDRPDDAARMGVFVFKSDPDDGSKKLAALDRMVTRSGGEFKLYKRSNIRISGLDGTLETYGVRVGLTHDKYSRLTVMRKGTCTQVLYMAPVKSFDRHEGEFETFIGSLVMAPLSK